MDFSNVNILTLKCSECDCFLSRIPIYLKEDGSAICGRCPIPQKHSDPAENSAEEIKVFRMKPFENLIGNMKFPCMYKNNGCQEEILSLDLQKHEENCKHRPYVCPILPSGTCDWIGSQDNFYEHCKSQHSTRILQHPCVFQHDITKNSMESYVTNVFNILFLVHTKVCLNTHKIFHSVHCLDYVPNMANMFFNLIIQRGHEKIVKRGKIEPIGCRSIKEYLSVSCGINSLIEIFGGFDTTDFTIEILCSNKCKICNVICNELVEEKYCKECSERIEKCKYADKDCTYEDIDIKISIHEKSLCRFTNWCWICEKHREDSPTLSKHYETAHKEAILNDEVFYNLTITMFRINQFDFILASKYDKFYCTLCTFEHNCLIEICSMTLKTEELNKLKCVLSIENNAEIKTVDLTFCVNNKVDWFEHFPRKYLFANNLPYQIKIDILEK